MAGNEPTPAGSPLSRFHIASPSSPSQTSTDAAKTIEEISSKFYERVEQSDKTLRKFSRLRNQHEQERYEREKQAAIESVRNLEHIRERNETSFRVFQYLESTARRTSANSPTSPTSSHSFQSTSYTYGRRASGQQDTLLYTPRSVLRDTYGLDIRSRNATEKSTRIDDTLSEFTDASISSTLTNPETDLQSFQEWRNSRKQRRQKLYDELRDSHVKTLQRTYSNLSLRSGDDEKESNTDKMGSSNGSRESNTPSARGKRASSLAKQPVVVDDDVRQLIESANKSRAEAKRQTDMVQQYYEMGGLTVSSLFEKRLDVETGNDTSVVSSHESVSTHETSHAHEGKSSLLEKPDPENVDSVATTEETVEDRTRTQSNIERASTYNKDLASIHGIFQNLDPKKRELFMQQHQDIDFAKIREELEHVQVEPRQFVNTGESEMIKKALLALRNIPKEFLTKPKQHEEKQEEAKDFKSILQNFEALSRGNSPNPSPPRSRSSSYNTSSKDIHTVQAETRERPSSRLAQEVNEDDESHEREDLSTADENQEIEGIVQQQEDIASEERLKIADNVNEIVDESANNEFTQTQEQTTVKLSDTVIEYTESEERQQTEMPKDEPIQDERLQSHLPETLSAEQLLRSSQDDRKHEKMESQESLSEEHLQKKADQKHVEQANDEDEQSKDSENHQKRPSSNSEEVDSSKEHVEAEQPEQAVQQSFCVQKSHDDVSEDIKEEFGKNVNELQSSTEIDTPESNPRQAGMEEPVTEQFVGKSEDESPADVEHVEPSTSVQSRIQVLEVLSESNGECTESQLQLRKAMHESQRSLTKEDGGSQSDVSTPSPLTNSEELKYIEVYGEAGLSSGDLLSLPSPVAPPLHSYNVEDDKSLLTQSNDILHEYVATSGELVNPNDPRALKAQSNERSLQVQPQVIPKHDSLRPEEESPGAANLRDLAVLGFSLDKILTETDDLGVRAVNEVKDNNDRAQVELEPDTEKSELSDPVDVSGDDNYQQAGKSNLVPDAQLSVENEIVNHVEVVEPETKPTSGIRSSQSLAKDQMLGETAEAATSNNYLTPSLVPEVSAASTQPIAPSNSKEKMLLKIKGKRHMYLTKVSMELTSINRGDVFILQAPIDANSAKLFLIIGKDASKIKRAKGNEIALRLRDNEWNTKATIVEVTDSENSREALEMWKLLIGNRWDGRVPKVKSAKEGGDDEKFEKEMESKITLYGNVESAVQFSIISQGKILSVKMLSSDMSYVVECGSHTYVWSGKHASQESRDAAKIFAQSLTQSNDETRVVLEPCGMESLIFKELFNDWGDRVTIEVKRASNPAVPDKTRYIYDRGGVDVVKTDKIDVAKMFAPPPRPPSFDRNEGEEDVVVDDRGEVNMSITMLAVNPSDSSVTKVSLPPQERGIFYSRESYIIYYTFRNAKDKEESVIYYWIGRGCTPAEQSVIALEVASIGKKLGHRQLRISQGREPDYFFQAFPIYVVREGRRNDFDAKARTMYHVFGWKENCIRAVAMSEWNLQLMNSWSSYVFNVKDRVYIWHGRGSIPRQIQVAREFAVYYLLPAPTDTSKFQEVVEGSEPKGFWGKISESGDKVPDYAHGGNYEARLTDNKVKARLFKISHIVHGNPTSEELETFVQSDLTEESIHILDAYYEIYVWIGAEAKSNFRDVRLAIETSLEYADHVSGVEKNRNLSREKVFLVRSGQEHALFKACFSGWQEWTSLPRSSSSRARSTSLSRFLKQDKKKTVMAPVTVVEFLEKLSNSTYTLEELKRKDDLPLGVDPAHIEDYMKEEDFRKVFKCSKEEFKALADWKQTELKRSSGFF